MGSATTSLFGTREQLIDLAGRTFWTFIEAVFGLLAFDTVSQGTELAAWDVALGAGMTAAITVVAVYARQRAGRPPAMESDVDDDDVAGTAST